MNSAERVKRPLLSNTDWVTKEVRAYFLDEGNSVLGVVDLVGFQMASFFGVGTIVGQTAGDDGIATGFGFSLVGAASALVFAITKGGLPAGHSWFINHVSAWSWIFLLSAMSMETRDFSDKRGDRAVWAFMLGATTFASAFVYDLFRPTAGQVSFATFLASTTVGLSLLITQLAFQPAIVPMGPTTMISSAVGLAGGITLAALLKPSRIWTMVLNAATGAMALGSYFFAISLGGMGPMDRAAFGMTAGFTAAGAIAATVVPLIYLRDEGSIFFAPIVTPGKTVGMGAGVSF